jgi:hypothetical protein
MKMSLLRECDHSGNVDREFTSGEPLCDKCRERESELRQEIWKDTKATFEAYVSAQASVLGLLLYMRDQRKEAFVEHYGQQGSDLLDTALSDIEAAKQQPASTD